MQNGGLSGRKKQLGRWKLQIPGRAFQSSLRISETGAKNPGSRPLERPFSGRERASAALVLGPVLQPQYSLSRKLSDNTDVTTERIRKTNLTLQQLSINSNMRYFGEIMRSVQFRISPVRLTDGQIRSSDLSGGVENQHLCINNHSQRGLPHYTVLQGVLQRSARQGPKITALGTLTETVGSAGEGNTNTPQ